MHHVCKGGCGNMSDVEGVCQTEGCSNMSKPFEACDCTDNKHGVVQTPADQGMSAAEAAMPESETPSIPETSENQ